MARNFVSGSAQYLRHAAAPVTDWPFTMSAHFKCSAVGTTQRTIISISDAAGAGAYAELIIAPGSPFNLKAQVGQGAGNFLLDSGVAPGTTNWAHAAFVGTSDSAHAVFCNGTKATDTTTVDFNGGTLASGLSIGRAEYGTRYFSGDIAEVGMWNAALDDAEIAALQKGFSPLLIRPASLVAYWPLVGNDSPELDRWKNRYDLTLTNAPAKADHPRVFYPSSPKIGMFVAVAANFAADLAAAAVVVASLSVGAVLSAEATGTATTTGALTTNPVLRANVTATATTTAALSVGAGLRADATGAATTSATFAEPIPVGSVSVRIGVTPWRTREGSMTIRDLLNAAPNVATFTVDGAMPTGGQAVEIRIGNGGIFSDLLFAGSILTVDQTYELLPEHLAWTLACQDHTRTFNRAMVRKRYAQQPATAIALDLATYAPGFSTAGIVAGLPTIIGGIDYTEVPLLTCFTRLASRYGGYADIDYTKLIRLFQTDAADPPDPLSAGYPFLDDPPIRTSTDFSQLRTRVRVEGGGSVTPTLILAGFTTLPIADGIWYSASGGFVVAGPQRISYTGRELSTGAGALVGTLAVPTTAPTAALANDVTGFLGVGDYDYAVTFYDGTGETTAGPIRTIAVGGPLPGPGAPTVTPVDDDAGNLTPGGYRYYIAFGTDSGLITAAGTQSASAVIPDAWGQGKVQLANIPISTTPGITRRHIYRGPVNNTTLKKFVVTLPDNVTTTFLDNVSDASLGADSLTPGTVLYNKVSLAGIPLGPAGTTGRKIQRTAVGGAQLKLLTTLANNTATTFVDGIVDASLGANVPTTNTSVITTAGGTVNAGATTLPVTGVSAFLSGGGWASAGGQSIRYTGKTDTALTGVPEAGTGAITSTLNFGTEILAASFLSGIPASGDGAILYDINQGEAVNILEVREDLVAQAALAAMEGGDSDGVYEHFIQDRSLASATAQATGDAELALFAYPIVTLTYATRDPKTRTGKTIHVDLPSLGLLGDFTIQSVTITEINVAPNTWPRYTVEASSVRFSLEDVLRRLQLGA